MHAHDVESPAVTRITEKTALIHAGLEALIAAEAAKRLARLGGSDRAAAAGLRHATFDPLRCPGIRVR